VTATSDHQAVPSAQPSLLRKVGVADAVLIGLGSMIGTGVFVVYAPAAAAAGAGMLVGLVIAAFVAYANATSSAALAARYPASGGTYVYGRERLGALWGFLAGIGFIFGKISSCAAAALAVGAYAAPGATRPVAAVAIVVITAVNYRGITKTVALNRILVALLLTVLTFVVVATLAGGDRSTERLTPWFPHGLHGTLQAAGLLFFAFAGYARIATLGDEVREPERTIPRAIPVALAITLLIYTAVALSVLLGLGPDRLAGSTAPLREAVTAGRFDDVAGIVRVGGALAGLSVLLSLVAGISRTTYAMATNGDLPRWLATVHPRYHVPHRAELVIGAAALVIVAVGGITGAVSFSAFTVLIYYAIANASAITLGPDERRWPRWLAIAGIAGCVVLAANLSWQALAAGTTLFVAAAVTHQVRARRRRRAPTRRP
jgi:APA family basic amino acid/polyamine antiporter